MVKTREWQWTRNIEPATYCRKSSRERYAAKSILRCMGAVRVAHNASLAANYSLIKHRLVSSLHCYLSANRRGRETSFEFVHPVYVLCRLHAILEDRVQATFSTKPYLDDSPFHLERGSSVFDRTHLIHAAFPTHSARYCSRQPLLRPAIHECQLLCLGQGTKIDVNACNTMPIPSGPTSAFDSCHRDQIRR